MNRDEILYSLITLISEIFHSSDMASSSDFDLCEESLENLRYCAGRITLESKVSEEPFNLNIFMIGDVENE